LDELDFSGPGTHAKTGERGRHGGSGTKKKKTAWGKFLATQENHRPGGESEERNEATKGEWPTKKKGSDET